MRFGIESSSKRIAYALSKIYQKEMTQEFVEWVGGEWFCAYSDYKNQIVGVYCITSMTVGYESDFLVVGLLNNAGVKKSQRGKGLFVELSKYALEVGGDQLDGFVGFSNQFALPGHKKVGLNHTSDALLWKVEKKDVQKFVDLDLNLYPLSKFCFDRNEMFMEWRYSKPTVSDQYLIHDDGETVLKSEGNGFSIMQMGPDETTSLLAVDTDYYRFWLSSDSEAGRILKKENLGSVEFVRHYVWKSVSKRFDFSEFDFCLADNDVF